MQDDAAQHAPADWAMDDPRRATRSVWGPGPYRVTDGRIVSETCELNITEHCNFTCKSCCHLSPAMPRRLVEPADVERDLTILARVYQVDNVKLVGGEPLLHPRIVEIIQAIRRSGVSNTIRVVTNGSLLHRMTDEFWTSVDQVHVSLYPGREPPAGRLAAFETHAAASGTELTVNRFERFRLSYSEQPASDPALVRRVYRSCQVANVWRCHTVRDGVFYRCPQSVFVPAVLAGRSHDPRADGLPILDTADLGPALLRFLEAEEPLRACTNCLGSAGLDFPHQQVPRAAWRKDHARPYESMVDLEFLERLEQDPYLENDCWSTVSAS